MAVYETSLPIAGPYHLGRTMTVLTMGTGNPCLRHDDHRAQLAMRTPEGPVALAATHAGETLRVLAQGEGAGWVEPHLPALFGLLDDPSGFQPTGRLLKIAPQVRGLRLPRLPIAFERLVQVALQQLIAFRDACRGWRRMLQRFGDEVPGSQGLYVPPSAERLAGLATYELMECDILPKHARLIQRLAKIAPAIERAWNAGVEPAAADRLTELLLKQPGVGPWTVGYLRGAGLGDADAVVLGDYGHPHHLAHFFTGAERSDDEEMLRLLEPFRPHRYRVLTMVILGAPPLPRRGPRREPLRNRFKP